MTNLDSILESKNITSQTKVHLVKAGFSSSHVWMWELDYKESWVLLNCGVGENSWDSLRLQGDQTSQS